MKTVPQIPRVSRLTLLTAGYLTALAGALSFFSIPLSLTFSTLIAGCGVTALASRREYAPPRFTWRSMLVWIMGSAVILGGLWLAGEERVRYWKPHPAGYQVAWLISLSLFRHLLHILRPEPAVPGGT